MILTDLRVPIVQAPMAGGPSTVALARAVCDAGGLGFLAGANRAPEDFRGDIGELREQTDRSFGVNVFVLGPIETDEAALRDYVESIAKDSERYGVAVGAPQVDDDGWDAKLAVILEERPAVASFTFGCPLPAVVDDLRGRGVEVWVTVTDAREAEEAARAGADALVVQGAEAGGHQGSFSDADRDGDALGLLALLQLVRATVDLPLVAAGGIATGAAVAAVLAAGASAAQIGTAFMLTPEAATHPGHRAALAADGQTAFTRAFSGRRARGIVNRFQARHSSGAPSAYPQIHHATTPMRAAARAAGNADDVNLWAGQAHSLAREAGAAEVVEQLMAEARDAIQQASLRA